MNLHGIEKQNITSVLLLLPDPSPTEVATILHFVSIIIFSS